MKVSEIAEAIRNGEMTLDLAGHRINHSTEDFLECYDDILAVTNGSYDGQWDISDNSPVDAVNERMRKHFKQRIDREVEQDRCITSMNDGETCFGCGEQLMWTLTGNKLQLRGIKNENLYRKNDNHPVDYCCPFHDPKANTLQIKIDSTLIFANFFRKFPDCLPEDKHTKKWSLNHLAGRRKVSEFKAKQNVANGQMSNMSIGIYVNENKDSIIVGPNFHPAEYKEFDSDEEQEAAVNTPLFPGYKQVGEISLEMWRWEATDLNTLTQEEFENVKKNSDVVEVEAKHGTWNFQHFYDTPEVEDEKSYIYSRLDLKES
jgi:hypothetical protein